MIKSICVDCHAILGYKADENPLERISHGLCAPCLKKKLKCHEIKSENSILPDTYITPDDLDS